MSEKLTRGSESLPVVILLPTVVLFLTICSKKKKKKNHKSNPGRVYYLFNKCPKNEVGVEAKTGRIEPAGKRQLKNLPRRKAISL